MGVLGSAAAEFVELEMWEEAVECYRHMQQVSVSLAPTVIGSNGVETPMKSDETVVGSGGEEYCTKYCTVEKRELLTCTSSLW